MREAVTLVSQALRVGELERADTNGEDADDGVGLLISEASSSGCECRADALRVCCVRSRRVRAAYTLGRSRRQWGTAPGDCGTDRCARNITGY